MGRSTSAPAIGAPPGRDAQDPTREPAGTASGDAGPPGDPDATRLAARAARRARRRRRLLWLLVGAAVAVVVWWLGWLSPFTRVQHVVVVAPDGISAKEVRTASGIAATDHVPAVNADRVRANVLAALPAVADLQVRRSLPATIRLTVVPRQAFAVLPSGGRLVVVDSGGVAFDSVRKAGDLPVVRAGTVEGRQAALAVLRSVPEDLRSDVRRVSASTANDVDLTLAGGSTVRWGSADEAQLKAQVLEGLRAMKAQHYDVSAPMLPTTS
jgi:cell division protein FtsQ